MSKKEKGGLVPLFFWFLFKVFFLRALSYSTCLSIFHVKYHNFKYHTLNTVKFVIRKLAYLLNLRLLSQQIKLKTKRNMTEDFSQKALVHCEHGVEIGKMQILCECILYWKNMHFLMIIVQNWSEYRHRSAKIAISKWLSQIQFGLQILNQC